MNLSNDKLALYATVYPGVEKYLNTWYDSVRNQTDQNFDIWIGLDVLSSNALPGDFKNNYRIKYVSLENSTPVTVRQKAIEQMTDRYSAVVFLDADDFITRDRITRVREHLEKFDVYGCAMRIVDESDRETGKVFNYVPNDYENLILRTNIFGFSNTAYRSNILKSCLPIPEKARHLDWFIVTRAVLNGASVTFDKHPQVYYRRYGENNSSILPPFQKENIIFAAGEIINHYGLILTHTKNISVEMKRRFEDYNQNTREFLDVFRNSPTVQKQYIEELNKTEEPYPWWDIVAKPELEGIWKR